MSDRFYKMLFAFFITGVTFAVMGIAYGHPPHSQSVFLVGGLLLVSTMVGLLSGAITAGYVGRIFTSVMLLVLLLTGMNHYIMTDGSFSQDLAELAIGYGLGFLFGRYLILRMRARASA